MNELLCEAGERLPEIPWNTYPRPTLRRREWLCLNGRWELRFSGGEYEITVPFPAESLLAGLPKRPKPGAKLVYIRQFEAPSRWEGKRVLLHFGAVMRKSRICVNGLPAAESENGYLPIEADITELVRPGENELTVECVNDLDFRHGYGKQRKRRGGMWYTPSSGIWQTVWLEPVPLERVTGIRCETAGDRALVFIGGADSGTITFMGEKYPFSGGKAEIQVKDPQFWTPETPKLYDFTVTAGEDEVESYFALRTLEIAEVKGKKRLLLNGEPYFFHGLLDQGYWSDGLVTPVSPELFEKDILTMKSLGFNMLRKHIKVEPELFYYCCDRLGMAVFQDMVNSGRYHYIRDTVMPTLGFKTRRDKRMFRNKKMRENFLRNAEKTVELLRKHPSICLWTIFNEGWGQFCSDAAYEAVKAQDPTRFIDSTSGWYHQEKSDVDSLHLYFEKLRLGSEDKAQFLSEYGGWSYKIPEHSFNLKKTYSYRQYETREEFAAALRAIFEEELVPLAAEGLCGGVYTQVSDVEDETNGLFTYDRRVLKVKPEELSGIYEALQKAVRE